MALPTPTPKELADMINSKVFGLPPNSSLLADEISQLLFGYDLPEYELTVIILDERPNEAFINIKWVNDIPELWKKIGFKKQEG